VGGCGGAESTVAACVPCPGCFCTRTGVWPGRPSCCETLSHCLYDTQAAETGYVPEHTFHKN
jgi:hypothetical protein